MKNYYFTFGSDPAYPYGQDDYVLVEAKDLDQAIHLFQAVHPNRPGSDCVNCAFWYGEERFKPIREAYYKETPTEIISLRVIRN